MHVSDHFTRKVTSLAVTTVWKKKQICQLCCVGAKQDAQLYNAEGQCLALILHSLNYSFDTKNPAGVLCV